MTSSTHTRTGSHARSGVNNSRKIPCARKPDTHGFHPANEHCSYCLTWLEEMEAKNKAKAGQYMAPGKWFVYTGPAAYPGSVYTRRCAESQPGKIGTHHYRALTQDEWAAGEWWVHSSGDWANDATVDPGVRTDPSYTRLP